MTLQIRKKKSVSETGAFHHPSSDLFLPYSRLITKP